MDSITLESLLNENESNYLDFKQAQYQFEGAPDEVKCEILKDILAFANAWRRTDAYILIGIKEVKGGRSQVIGITNHFDDASLQQFVNSKVQKPIDFSYIAFEFEKKQVGIIKIPIQERPFYLKQKYGKLKSKVVYLRRGSSTDEAEPDEIAKMGIALVNSVESQIPQIDCEFVDPISRKLLSKEIKITSTVLNLNEPIQNFSPRRSTFDIASSPNRNFYRELYKYYGYRNLLNKVGIRLNNTGNVTAFNVRVEINIVEDELLFVHDRDYPNRPKKYNNFLVSRDYGVSLSAITQIKSRLSINKNGAGWLITINFGNIQPKAEDWLEEPIFIGCRKPLKVQFDAIIYADNIPNPIHIPLCIDFHTNDVAITIKDLESDHDQILEKELQELYPDE